ncbi:unnamed protein product [Fusarium graminearum]|uniref:Uncharacterized protein n=1 Tax=Gibberella zeae TaxID=5518 RepID=A0A4E9EHC0_GIBZA|nr:unnamed protein product [Fusarium graminearum]CAF3506738.1 unnamed protein product [Fusarium graminearum]
MVTFCGGSNAMCVRWLTVAKKEVGWGVAHEPSSLSREGAFLMNDVLSVKWGGATPTALRKAKCLIL